MKKVIKKRLIITGTAIGIVAAGYLAISVGFQGIYTKAIFGELKHQTAVETTDEHLAKKRAELDSETVPAIVGSTANDITVEFNIIQIDNQGFVHGSNPTGKGEGIYYSLDTFKKYGAGNVKVGDTVDVTLPIEDYQNDDWENVKNIQKVM